LFPLLPPRWRAPPPGENQPLRAAVRISSERPRACRCELTSEVLATLPGLVISVDHTLERALQVFLPNRLPGCLEAQVAKVHQLGAQAGAEPSSPATSS